MGQVVNATPRPHYLRNDQVPIVQGSDWVPVSVLTDAENEHPTGVQFLDRPACGESLYLLGYSGPQQMASTLAKCLPGHCHCSNTAHVLGHLTYQMTLTVHTHTHTHKSLVCLSSINETLECKKSRPDKHTNTGNLNNARPT